MEFEQKEARAIVEATSPLAELTSPGKTVCESKIAKFLSKLHNEKAIQIPSP